jgi:hypothetical protein
VKVLVLVDFSELNKPEPLGIAAKTEERSPLVDGPEARKALVIVDALYRAAELGRWVELTE